MRKRNDFEIIHEYLMKTNTFFINVAKTKSIEDMFKIYKALSV